MHFKALFISLCSLAALVLHTTAHAVILTAQGDAGTKSKLKGPVGTSLGIDPSITRTGTTNTLDTPVFMQRKMSSWKGCGQTNQLGVLDLNKLTTKLVSQGQIAQVSPGGFLYMILRQINANGKGPYTCGIDTTGTGNSYSELTITKQVPESNIQNGDAVTQFPFQVAMPLGLICTGSYGGKDNICMIRCQNSVANGPYGGCVPVQVVS